MADLVGHLLATHEVSRAELCELERLIAERKKQWSSACSLAAWLEPFGLLALGSTVLIVLAALLGRGAPAAVWRRTLWRATLAGLAILIVSEATGTANWLAFQLTLPLDPSRPLLPSNDPFSDASQKRGHNASAKRR